jgi:hypothetical protein
MIRRPEKSSKDEGPRPLRILTQYHDKRGMVYELACGTSAVDVHITREMTDGTEGGWRVEAHDGRLSTSFVIVEAAATRAEALRRVGESWSASAPDRGLPEFDWDAVAALLVGVRAL